MRPVQKVLTTMLWACAVLAMVSAIGTNLWRDRAGAAHRAGGAGDADLAAGGREDAEAGSAGAGDARADDQPLRVTRDVPAFSLVDQNGQPVTLESLKG